MTKKRNEGTTQDVKNPLDFLQPDTAETKAEETAQVEEVQEINPYENMSAKEKAEAISKAIIESVENSTYEMQRVLEQYGIFDIRHPIHVQVKKNKQLLKIIDDEAKG